MRFPHLLTGACLLALTACSGNDVRDSLGLDRKAPDEFTVYSRPPLSVPPEFDLKPPQPGAPPLTPSTEDIAKETLLGSKEKPLTSNDTASGDADAGVTVDSGDEAASKDDSGAKDTAATPSLLDDDAAANKDAASMPHLLDGDDDGLGEIGGDSSLGANDAAKDDAKKDAATTDVPATADDAAAKGAAPAAEPEKDQPALKLPMESDDTAISPVEESDPDTAPTSGFMDKIGADEAAPDIREQLGDDQLQAPERKKDAPSLFERIWGDDEQPVVDPKGEAERLRKNKDEGKPVTEGDTPTEDEKAKSVIDQIF